MKPTEVLRKVASNTKLEFPAQTPHRLKVQRGGGALLGPRRAKQGAARSPAPCHGRCSRLPAGAACMVLRPGWPHAPPPQPLPARRRSCCPAQILGERCMEYQPSTRPTMDEVLSGGRPACQPSAPRPPPATLMPRPPGSSVLACAQQSPGKPAGRSHVPLPRRRRCRRALRPRPACPPTPAALRTPTLQR